MLEQVDLLLTYIRARLGREEGQALVEYALIVSLIALLAVGGLTLAGTQVNTMFSAIADKLNIP
jgi:pilus assembly protein Flp/PilA